jgi:predicted peptidase
MKKVLLVVVAVLAVAGIFNACDSPATEVSGQYPIPSGPKLDLIEVAESSQEARLSPPFDPNIFNYVVRVPNVTMGVKVATKAAEGLTVDIWGDLGIDNRVWGTGSQHIPVTGTGVGNWPNGQWPYGKQLEYFPSGTATVKTIYNDGSANAVATDYNGGRVVNAYVTVSNGDESNTYNLKIIVDDERITQNYFLKDLGYIYNNGTPVDDTDDIIIRYNIYIPKRLSANEKLPVVYALHGSGLRAGNASGILTRYEMATIWAKDSEQGINKCIVLAPQSSNQINPSGTNWYGGSSPYSVIANAGEGAYELLQKVIAGSWDDLVTANTAARAFAVTGGNPSLTPANNGVGTLTRNQLPSVAGVGGDPTRIYITGLSMGGGGTMVTIKKYASTFAAALPMVANVKWQASDFTANPAIRNVAFKFVHDRYDPTVDFQYHLDNLKAVADDGGTWKEVGEVVYSTDTVADYYYEAPHYSWVRAYRDPVIRNWLFAQHK